MADQPSSDSTEQASYPCHDPAHQRLDEREEQIHTLIHQGMAAMGSECLDQADAAYGQARTLALHQQWQQWEAQTLFRQGAVRDNWARYTEPIPLFEQAQQRCAER